MKLLCSPLGNPIIAALGPARPLSRVPCSVSASGGGRLEAPERKKGSNSARSKAGGAGWNCEETKGSVAAL
jgi:hypothetical protein